MSEQPMQSQESDQRIFIVEPAKPEDAEGIVDVQRLTWLATYPNADAGITEEDVRTQIEGKDGKLIPAKVERWEKALEDLGDERAVFVVKDGNKVIGYTAPAVMDGQKRIGAIYVLPGAQGKGIGRKLLDKAIEWHGRDEDIFLHAVNYNKNAIDFYKLNGFEETGREIIDDMAGKPLREVEMVLRASSN